MTSDKLKILIAEGEGLTVEFKERYTPKIDRDIVALANAKGGFILLGVNDESKVVGENLTNQMKAEILSIARNCEPHITISKISRVDNVVVVEVPEGDEKPYSCSSGYFRRLDAVTQKMVQKEIRSMIRESTDVHFESLPCKGFSFGDISLGKVRTFLKEAQASFKVSKDVLPSFLSSLSIIKDGRNINAGALMFAGEINKFIPYSETILAAFKGTTKTHIYDRKDVRDDLLTQLNEAMAFLKKHLNVRSEIRELNRHDIYEIPLDALREALVNAIVHRDYSMRGTNISVNVFDNRVEIVNPGGLPAGISKANFGKESVRRNLIIADLFHRMDKMERVGSGIGRMRELMKGAGLKEPVFESDTFFRAIFYRNPEFALKSSKGVNEGASEGVNEGVKSLLGYIHKNPGQRVPSMSQSLEIAPKTLERWLKQLKDKGKIKFDGSAKTGGYYVVDKNQ
ncbi:MAG: ATP-binding protein [Kiritimatiellia bacterium]|nr:ATP-binding protein [Kiritimatiellia bacterium]